MTVMRIKLITAITAALLVVPLASSALAAGTAPQHKCDQRSAHHCGEDQMRT